MVLITHIRLAENGFAPEHIIRVRWEDTNNTAKPTGEMDIPTTISWLEQGNHAYVSVGRDTAEVTVVRPSSGRPYIKTRPDHTTRDNLLSLPRF
jgi:hypothetical protein